MSVQLMQLISSAIFACASAVIAAVSLFVAFRNNFGWPPIALITDYWIGSKKEFPDILNMTVEFELWNRRKYPVVIRETKLFLGDVEVIWNLEKFEYPKEWSLLNSSVVGMSASMRLEGNAHHTYNVTVPIKRIKVDDGSRSLRVHISYFDPTTSKDKVVSGTSLFAFG